jgi:hypothetical protein
MIPITTILASKKHANNDVAAHPKPTAKHQKAKFLNGFILFIHLLTLFEKMPHSFFFLPAF